MVEYCEIFKMAISKILDFLHRLKIRSKAPTSLLVMTDKVKTGQDTLGARRSRIQRFQNFAGPDRLWCVDPCLSPCRSSQKLSGLSLLPDPFRRWRFSHLSVSMTEISKFSVYEVLDFSSGHLYLGFF